MKELRASEADVLNQELRENYGGSVQVEPEDDWRPAIKALVDGVRYGERFTYSQQLAEAEKFRKALHNCYTLARRSTAETNVNHVQQWAHVISLCESAGCCSTVLREGDEDASKNSKPETIA